MSRTYSLSSSWRLACRYMSISIRLVRSRFFSPYARGPTAARIELMNPSNSEVLNGVSAGRVERCPRRRSWSSTTCPVVVRHSLRRGMPAACALDEQRPQQEAGGCRLDTCNELIDRGPAAVLGSDLAHEPLQRMAQGPLAQVQPGAGKRIRTAFTRAWSLSHTTRGGFPGRAPRNASQSACDVLVCASQSPQLRAPGREPHHGEDAEHDPGPAAVRIADTQRQAIQ